MAMSAAPLRLLHAGAALVIRAGVDAPDSVSFQRGVELGAREAGATAALLGAKFELGSDGMRATLRQPGRHPAALHLLDRKFELTLSEALRSELRAAWSAKDASVSIVEWHWTLEKYGAGELNERFRRRFASEMDGQAWAGWFGVKVMLEAALRAQTSDLGLLSSRIPGMRFDGHKGVRLQFVDSVLRQPLYVVSEDRVVAEIAP